MGRINQDTNPVLINSLADFISTLVNRRIKFTSSLDVNFNYVSRILN